MKAYQLEEDFPKQMGKDAKLVELGDEGSEKILLHLVSYSNHHNLLDVISDLSLVVGIEPGLRIKVITYVLCKPELLLDKAVYPIKWTFFLASISNYPFVTRYSMTLLMYSCSM